MKTGRPHKTESETKDIVKHIRYSPDEWSRVEAKLQQSGRTFSEFVRQATFSANVMPSLDMGQITTLRELKVSLDRVGNNINQIAKKYNEHQYVEPSADLLDKLDEVYAMMKSTIQIMKGGKDVTDY